MKASTKRVLLAYSLALGLTGPGCGVEDGADGIDGTSCTIADDGDGTATISCSDGTTATITSGADGVNGTNGTNGTNGNNGTSGSNGTDGLSCSVAQLSDAIAQITCEDGTVATLCGEGDQPYRPNDDDYRYLCQPAEQQVAVADGLSVAYLTREIANKADQFVFWPHGAGDDEITHAVFCIEGKRELIDGTRYNPSVQSIDLATGEIHTILRGLTACDGLRTTPWGTVVATEEAGQDGGFYELLFDPSDAHEYTVTDRATGAIVDEGGASGAAVVAKRTALPVIAWEGIGILSSGVVIGGDELRPGSGTADADGGAIFKFVPETLRTTETPIATLTESPLVAGESYALRVHASSNAAQDIYGQGQEVGKGRWVPVAAATARADADAAGATGYYRPEDLEIDPHFAGPSVRFCVANTGNRGAANYGEILCGVDTDPDAAPTDTLSVTVNRLLEGDPELNAPDNFAFHPTVPGLFYVIEDNGHGDVWACLPDGDDRDIKSDGCVRAISVKDGTAEPTGFIFYPSGEKALVSIQHSADGNMPLVDDYATDDILVIRGFGAPDEAAIAAFGLDTAADLEADVTALFGFGTPVPATPTVALARETTFPGGVAPDVADNGHGDDASGVLELAAGLDATFLTRIAADWVDQGNFYPYGSADPDFLVFCIESSMSGTPPSNPSVQAIDLATGDVTTIVRGMQGCDGLRVTPWNTLLATEEFIGADGGAYEILWDPATLDGVEFSIDHMAMPETIAVTAGVLPSGTVSDYIVRRTALPSMAWEGIGVLESGVVYGGDELTPGTAGLGADGGGLFKFLPATLRTASDFITDLDDSPLVAGTVHALQVSCQSSTQQYGQGCEIGKGAWIALADATDARALADANGATGYFRPEDLQIDPNYEGAGVRFCFANTQSRSAGSYGEVLCAVDTDPDAAVATSRTVTINRFIEGDGQFNQPDNIEIQPGTGIVYVIEDSGFGDVWACLPDGADRDIKSDGCVRFLSLEDDTAEPTGFLFHPAGDVAYLAIQHSADPVGAVVDGYPTDDVVMISGFAALGLDEFGLSVEARLTAESTDLFGFGAPLAMQATEDR